MQRLIFRQQQSQFFSFYFFAVPVLPLAGEEATTALKEATRLRVGSELAHPTSFDSLIKSLILTPKPKKEEEAEQKEDDKKPDSLLNNNAEEVVKPEEDGQQGDAKPLVATTSNDHKLDGGVDKKEEEEKKPELPPSVSVGPNQYVNKYRNGWTAAISAIKAAVDEAKRKKTATKGGLWIPTGTCGRLVVPELPVPLPLSKFQWPLLQGRTSGKQMIRCGKCHTCTHPSLRKGCLKPIVKTADDVAQEVTPDTTASK